MDVDTDAEGHTSPLRFTTDENMKKIARLNLEEETDSQLEPQASGENVKTPKDCSSWMSNYIVPQTSSIVNEE